MRTPRRQKNEQAAFIYGGVSALCLFGTAPAAKVSFTSLQAPKPTTPVEKSDAAKTLWVPAALALTLAVVGTVCAHRAHTLYTNLRGSRRAAPELN